MPGLFIDVQVDDVSSEVAAKLVEVCPVDIFEQNGDGNVCVVEDKLDECVLCDLCLEAVPAGKLEILRLYEREA